MILNNVVKYIVLILLISVLNACANIKVQPYAEPTDGPIANIRLYQVSGGASYFSTFLESENCTGRRQIFKNASGITEYKTITANKDFAFTIAAGPSGNLACVAAGIFNPNKDGFYNVRVEYTSEHCIISLFRYLNKEGGKEINVPFKKMEFVTPWDETGSFCKEPE